jgi:yecA family protein
MLAPPKYDHTEIERLFAAGPLAEHGYGLYFTSGFILSVVSAPDLVQMSEWLPVAFESGELPEFESQKQIEAVTAGLMSIWSLWVEQIEDEELRLTLQPGCTMASKETPSPALIDFCQGYLQGYSWLEETWDHVLEGLGEGAEEDSIIGGSIMVCMIITDNDRYREEIAKAVDRLIPTCLADAFDMLPYLLKESAQTGWRLYREMIEDRAPLQRKVEKIQPNGPCPCGSGKKYKKCCMNK